MNCQIKFTAPYEYASKVGPPAVPGRTPYIFEVSPRAPCKGTFDKADTGSNPARLRFWPCRIQRICLLQSVALHGERASGQDRLPLHPQTVLHGKGWQSVMR